MTDVGILKTAGTLAVLLALAPISAAVVALCLLATPLSGSRRARSGRPRTVLVSGGKMTKALQLARSFHAAGHRVVLVEVAKYRMTGHRFSHAVHRFCIVPEPTAPDYADALLEIVRRESVDVYVPVCSPVASIHDARVIGTLSPYCEVIHVAPDLIDMIDDKYAFAQVAASLDLPAPKSFRITDPAQVEAFDFASERRTYILKSIAYDAVRRLDLTKLPLATPQATSDFVRSLPISPGNPWVMQEFIEGAEYCTHATVRDGELRVHLCCESAPFQVNYAHVDKPEIEAWVRRLVGTLELTGQVSLDFIEAADDGLTYAIECNPRTHSAITMLYDHPDVAAAYLGEPLAVAPIVPLPTSRPTYWLFHELWRIIVALPSPAAVAGRLRVIAAGKEAVFDWRDPLPFLMLHHWHVPRLLLRELRERRGWFRIDFNIGKLVQAGGD